MYLMLMGVAIAYGLRMVAIWHATPDVYLSLPCSCRIIPRRVYRHFFGN